jgi:hypothetical protein
VKKLLIIAIIAVLVTTGGAFASAQQTTTTSISVTNGGGDFAAVTAEDLSAMVPDVYGDFVGSWTVGPLFTVTPYASYNGDLVIEVYLTNTGELSRCYEHANMEIQFLDSGNNPADDQGISQILSLDNSKVIFTWSNGTGTGPYKVQLVGGGFRLHSWKTMSGGSVQPKLWTEVLQR